MSKCWIKYRISGEEYNFWNVNSQLSADKIEVAETSRNYVLDGKKSYACLFELLCTRDLEDIISCLADKMELHIA